MTLPAYLDWLPDWFSELLRTNSTGTWLTALIVFVAALAILVILRSLITRRCLRMGDTSQRLLYLQWVGQLVGRTHRLVLLLVALYAGLAMLELPAKADTFITILVKIALILQILLWANHLVTLWIENLRNKPMETAPGSTMTLMALGFLLRIALFTVVLLVVLQQMQIEITPLITGLGVAGIAVGLAVQNVLGDLFASMSIVLDKPFQIGDFIIVDTYLGVVEKVGLKTTRIRSLSGEQLVFSNSDLLNSRIRNYKRMAERRVVFGFGILYQTPYEKLKEVPRWVREIIEQTEQTRFDRAHFHRYGESSLDFEVVYYIPSPDYNLYMDIQQQINLAIFQKFEQEGVSFAYPTRTIYIEPNEAPSPPTQGSS